VCVNSCILDHRELSDTQAVESDQPKFPFHLYVIWEALTDWCPQVPKGAYSLVDTGPNL
jgi:hypothetical protein